MTNTSGLIKSLNKAVANFYLKHSEESLLYLQAFFKAGHMLCCALLRRVKNSLHSSGFSFSLFCLDYFHTWRVFCSHLRSAMRGQPVQECILMPPLSTVLMHVLLFGDFWQITGSGSKLAYKGPRNVIFSSGLLCQVTAWALEPVQKKETLGAEGSLLGVAPWDYLKFIWPQRSGGFVKVMKLDSQEGTKVHVSLHVDNLSFFDR